MIYTEQIVRETLERGETFFVECKLAKREIPGTFWESFSAFANSDGGVIFLGVREENHEFTVEGVEDARKIVTDFWNMVHSPNKVSAEVVFERNVQIVNCGGKNIVVVEVPRAERQDRPVYVGEDVFRGTFRRNGERSGFGLSQLYGTWESAGYAKPVFKESFDPDRMRIEVEFEVAEKVGKVAEKVAEKVGQVAEKVAEKAKDSHASITETEEKIVEMVRENPHVTQSAISIRIGLTRQYVGRCMDALQAKGVIRRVGPDKGGIWEVVGGI